MNCISPYTWEVSEFLGVRQTRPGWRCRWFVLREGILCYYVDEHKVSHRSHYNLVQASSTKDMTLSEPANPSRLRMELTHCTVSPLSVIIL